MNPEGTIPAISLIIPSYNEQSRIAPTLRNAAEYLSANYPEFELIVVDDGSSDQTKAVVLELAKEIPQLRLLALNNNRGKGYAVKFGVLNSRGLLVGFADADGSTPIEELKRLSQALANGAEIAIGSRALKSNDTQVEALWYRRLLGRLFNLVINLVVVPGIADTQCGFKLFTRRAADFVFSRQSSERFSFDVEILHIAQRAAIGIAEVPVNWHNVPGSKVNLITDALQMLYDACRFRLRNRNVSPQDYMNSA